MFGLKLLFLPLTLSTALVAENFTAGDVCGNLAKIVNVAKVFTDLCIDVDFGEGNQILHGRGTIKLTDDIAASCEAVPMDSKTILFLGNIKDNISIHFPGRKEVIEILDCEIVAHITLTRDAPDVTISPHLIEVKDFKSVISNGTKLDPRVAEELVKPDLTKALTGSDIGRTRVISKAPVDPFLPKQLLHQVYQYYFYRLNI